MQIDNNFETPKFGVPSIGIPAELFFNAKFTRTEQMAFGLIRNLAQSSKGCWATNSYLARILRVNPQTITNAVSKLKKYQYINVKMETKDKITTRRIFINNEYPKLYSKLVKYVHDCLEDGKEIDESVCENLYPPIFFEIPPYTNFDNKEVNKEVIKNKYKNTCYSRSDEREKNEKNGKRKRKRKRKTDNTSDNTSDNRSSMSDKIKQKKSSKNSQNKRKKLKYESSINEQLVSYWNEQPNLRTHKINTESKTYQKCLQNLEKLQTGTLFKKHELNDDILFGMKEHEYLRSYSVLEIRKAIKILNDSCNPGNKNSLNCAWIKKLSLADAIRHSMSGKSPLIQFYHKGIEPIFDPLKKLKNDDQINAYKILEQFFLKFYKKQTLLQIHQFKILNWINEIQPYAKQKISYIADYIVRALNGSERTVYDYLTNEQNLIISKVLSADALLPGRVTFQKISDAYEHVQNINILVGEKNIFSSELKPGHEDLAWQKIQDEMDKREQMEDENNEEVWPEFDEFDNIIGYTIKSTDNGNSLKERIVRKDGHVIYFNNNGSVIKKIQLKNL